MRTRIALSPHTPNFNVGKCCWALANSIPLHTTSSVQVGTIFFNIEIGGAGGRYASFAKTNLISLANSIPSTVWDMTQL